MAQGPVHVNNLKVEHKDLGLKFGLDRVIDFNFAYRDRNWSCLKNATIESSRTDPQISDRDNFDQQDKRQLLEKRRALEKEMMELKDAKARLEVQRVAMRLIVAESLKDYHEQFKMILTAPKMELVKIGPQLLELNRENFELQLDISKIKPPSEEENKKIEDRVSERLNARLSNLASPEAPKTHNTRAISGDKRLTTSETGGRSTAVSTQRPVVDRSIRTNAKLSPNTRSGHGSGSRSPMNSGMGSAKSLTPAMVSNKDRIMQKKNATIEEESENDSNPSVSK